MAQGLGSEKLKKILVEPGYVSESDFAAAEKIAEAGGALVERALVERGFISDEHLSETVAGFLDCYPFDIDNEKITSGLVGLIPEAVARAQEAIVFRHDADGLHLATTHPDNFEFIKLLEKKTGKKLIVHYATPVGIDEALKYYKSNYDEIIRKIVKELEEYPENEKNIVKLTDAVLEYAHDSKASDIHLEPLEGYVSMRFRVDGVLHEVLTYPPAVHEKITSRIKIMSRLRTDEHAAAQDGRFDFKAGRDVFDVRVSIMPISDGENVVMRILSEHSRRLALGDLGILEPDLTKVEKALKKPHGMLVAVGPTGSGKTTTLYALLHIVNTEEVNIMTIEDPVEFNIVHVQQTQVNQKKNLTFATGLRAIVRQDPDIIMVGEIRDGDTADIAVNAAMTGHLLLSSMHANDSATLFPRLVELGIEPFLASSSVNIVISQRLVRKICSQCITSAAPGKEELEMVRANKVLKKHFEDIYERKDLAKIRLYRGSGCGKCGTIGYRGRVGIFEVLEVTDGIRKLITSNAPAPEIREKAAEEGMTTMLYDGVRKVHKGITTLEEVVRATKF